MKLNMRFMAGNIVDGILYFSNTFYNGLFKMELTTEKIEFIGTFNEIPLGSSEIHRKCLTYKKWLIFVPNRLNIIHFVNVETAEQKILKIAEDDKHYMSSDAVIVDDSLYVIPGQKEQPLIIIHLDDDFKIDYPKRINEWIRAESPNKPDDSVYYSLGAVKRNNNLFIGLCCQNRIIQYDFHSEDIKLQKTGVERIRHITNGQKGIWVTDFKGGRVELIGDTTEEYQTGQEYSYRNIIDTGSNVYAIPGNASHIGIINEDKSVRMLDYPEEFKDFETNYADKFFGYTIYRDEIYLFPYAHDNMLVISGDKLRTVKTVYETDPAGSDPKQLIETIQAYRGRIIRENGGLITESPEFTLDSYMEYIGLLD